MVIDSYAVADPGAVVVHAHYTLVADGAVVRAWGFHLLALLAEAETDETATVSGEHIINTLLSSLP